VALLCQSIKCPYACESRCICEGISSEAEPARGGRGPSSEAEPSRGGREPSSEAEPARGSVSPRARRTLFEGEREPSSEADLVRGGREPLSEADLPEGGALLGRSGGPQGPPWRGPCCVCAFCVRREVCFCVLRFYGFYVGLPLVFYGTLRAVPDSSP
jgi:hypothetical protein